MIPHPTLRVITPNPLSKNGQESGFSQKSHFLLSEFHKSCISTRKHRTAKPIIKSVYRISSYTTRVSNTGIFQGHTTTATGLVSVSYTHLTLPTKRIV